MAVRCKDDFSSGRSLKGTWVKTHRGRHCERKETTETALSRWSYATRCAERGEDVKSVSELLGHADVRTTLRLYVHSSMDYKRRAVEGIGFLKGIT